MSIGDEIAAENSAIERADLIKLRRERDAATAEVIKLRGQVTALQRTLDVIGEVETVRLEPPSWLRPLKPKVSAATLVLMLSDLHLDEVVNPEEIDHLNAFNRDIAIMRLRRWTENAIKLARHHLSGIKYDGLVILLGGDLFSGDIHEELAETNEASILDSLLFWSEQLAAAIDVLATEFQHVHIANVIGNHGRMSRKPRAKMRAKTNFDWLLAKMLERHFNGDRRLTFQIPEGADCLVKIYGQGHLLTHGDQTSGGGGIGGIYPPIMRMRARKSQRYLTINEHFATLWLGHWHTYLPSPYLVVNGSMKGWDEFCAVMNLSYEPPQQALAIVAPDKGIVFHAPVFCADRKKERW